MFKKLVAVFLALSAISVSTLAEQTTNRMNAFEYTELFIQRTAMLKYEDDIDLGLPGSAQLYYATEFAENSYLVETSGATIQIDQNDLSVISLMATLMTLKDDEDTDENDTFTAILAFSALEFDAMADSTIQLAHRYGLSDYADANTKAFCIFEDQIFPVFMENIETLINGEKIVVYKGKYTWSIDYTESGDYQMFYLIAE